MNRKKIALLLIIVGIVYTTLYYINAYTSYAFINILPEETATISRIGIYLAFTGIIIFPRAEGNEHKKKNSSL